MGTERLRALLLGSGIGGEDMTLLMAYTHAILALEMRANEAAGTPREKTYRLAAEMLDEEREKLILDVVYPLEEEDND